MTKLFLSLLIIIWTNFHYAQVQLSPQIKRSTTIGDSILSASYGTCLFEKMITFDSTYSRELGKGYVQLFYLFKSRQDSNKTDFPLALTIDSSLNLTKEHHGLLKESIAICNLYSLDSAVLNTQIPKNKKAHSDYKWSHEASENYGSLTIDIYYHIRYIRLLRSDLQKHYTYNAITGKLIKSEKLKVSRMGVSF